MDTQQLIKIYGNGPFVRLVLAWLAITAAVLIVAGSCTEGGTYQGGGDDEPYYRSVQSK
jgi:hypothetical protein